MSKNKKNELIMVLVNKGFVDIIIEKAREQGATGGTIITARGSGRKEAENKYGLVITPDKDVIMILVNADCKKRVMEAIYKVAGIETKGMAIIFSLPVDNVVGFKRKASKIVKSKK